jgi:hypothetical protein
VEVDLRAIKTTLQMAELSCNTPEMNEKEIWVHFLAYNLIRLLMAQAAQKAAVRPRTLTSNTHCNCGVNGLLVGCAHMLMPQPNFCSH